MASIRERGRKRKNSGDEDQTTARRTTPSDPAGMLSFRPSEPDRGSVDSSIPTHHGHPFTDNAGLIHYEFGHAGPSQLFPGIRHSLGLPIPISVFGVEGMNGRPMPHIESPVNTTGPPLPLYGFTMPDAAPPSRPSGAVGHGVFGTTHVNPDVNSRACVRCCARGKLCEGVGACKRCNDDHLHCIRQNLATIANVSANGRCMSQPSHS